MRVPDTPQRRLLRLLDDPEAVAQLPVTDPEHAASEVLKLFRARECLEGRRLYHKKYNMKKSQQKKENQKEQ